MTKLIPVILSITLAGCSTNNIDWKTTAITTAGIIAFAVALEDHKSEEYPSSCSVRGGQFNDEGICVYD